MKIMDSVRHRQDQKEIDQILINIRNGRRDDGNYILSFPEQKRIGYLLLRAYCLIDEVSEYEELCEEYDDLTENLMSTNRLITLVCILLSCSSFLFYLL